MVQTKDMAADNLVHNTMGNNQVASAGFALQQKRNGAIFDHFAALAIGRLVIPWIGAPPCCFLRCQGV